ncbi:Putative membrane protein Q2 colocalized with Q [Streptomyces formicae]|uniref:Membrane protein Q2 colocalized with Q n=1 Tax=Streptomyces formicae TaxID=1616117 RepID=A0A291QED2_9ACTN|nr:Putative membrane protein Q2 colocalized with Q [Streptomyces formicae]
MDTGKSEVSGAAGAGERGSAVRGWLLLPASWHAWAVLGVVLLAGGVRVGLAVPDGGMDNAIVVRAAEAWLHGRSPYADRHFLYLPGAVLAAVPQAVLPTGVLRFLVPLAVTAGLVFGWGCALRIHGVALGSRFAVFGLLGLALGFAPFGHLVALGNWTVASAAVLPLALLLVRRGRWVAAGLAVGAAVAVKPLLAPVVLLFVFGRRWRALAVAVGVPVALSVAVALLLPDPGGFFTRTLPFLVRGDDSFVRLYEASPAAVLARLGAPRSAATLLALGAAAAGVWCAWRRWGRGGEGAARVVESAVMLMLAAFLVSRPSYDHYLLVVLPLLLAGVLTPGAVGRSPWFWVALVPQVPGFTWPWLEEGTRRAFKDAVTLCLLAAVVGWRCVTGGTVNLEEQGRRVRWSRTARPRVRVLTRTGQRG